MPERTVVCVGNLTIDEAVAPDGHRVESAGGDALFAALAARWAPGDHEIRVLAPLGTDASADLLTAVRATGTDPADLPRRAQPTVRNVIHYAPDGSRVWDLLLGEDHFEALSVHPADVDDSVLAADGILLSGMGLRAQLELAAWVRPRTSATVFFDPQEDYVAGNEGGLRDAVGACDVFLPSEVEAVALAATDDLPEAARRFLALGPRAVVIKRAEAGCLVATREQPVPVAVPADVVPAVDATGAGDAFCGAFAAAYSAGADAVTAARTGAAAARIAVQGPGVRALLDALHHRTGVVAG